jgi:hypothetical protein
MIANICFTQGQRKAVKTSYLSKMNLARIPIEKERNQ